MLRPLCSRLATTCFNTVTIDELFSTVHRLEPESVRAFSLAVGEHDPLHLVAQIAARSRDGQSLASARTRARC